MTGIRTIFLDAGGTLIHLDRAFILKALEDVGVEKDEAAFLIADQSAREQRAAAIRRGEVLDDASSWRIYAARLLELLEATGDAATEVSTRVKQRHRAGTLWTHVEPGTLETLAQLKGRGFTLGVVSNADGRVASFLELVGINKYLDFVVDSGAVGVEKPNPRIFQIALEQARATPEQAVHVGDVYEVDVVGARAAGIEPIMLVSNGGPEPKDVRVIRSFTELATQFG
jgi:putative hydrolase of the HAD superfamily